MADGLCSTVPNFLITADGGDHQHFQSTIASAVATSSSSPDNNHSSILSSSYTNNNNSGSVVLRPPDNFAKSTVAGAAAIKMKNGAVISDGVSEEPQFHQPQITVSLASNDTLSSTDDLINYPKISLAPLSSLIRKQATARAASTMSVSSANFSGGGGNCGATTTTTTTLITRVAATNGSSAGGNPNILICEMNKYSGLLPPPPSSSSSSISASILSPPIGLIKQPSPPSLHIIDSISSNKTMTGNSKKDIDDLRKKRRCADRYDSSESSDR